jgi:hypothetical protein
MVEFSHLDSPREACAVCALDMMANANNWQEAVKVVAKEIKKMAFFGLSVSTLRDRETERQRERDRNRQSIYINSVKSRRWPS